MFLSLFRALKFSIQDISRNFWLSVVTVVILFLSLFSINVMLTVKVVGDLAVDVVKDKIDVSWFLSTGASEEEILALKAQVNSLSEVDSIKYLSKEDALEIFKEKHRDDPDILQSLNELGKNPLTPALIIKPKDVDRYDDLITNLNKIDNDIIVSRNFTDYKTMISKINAITNKVAEAGIVISIIFIFITILVVYNSIRVAIYTHKQEIAIMKLVGASNFFVNLPYVFSSLFYTLFGLAFVWAIYYPFLGLLQPYLEAFFVGENINIIDYFNVNFVQIFALQFFVTAIINIIASLIAVKKYADV